MNLSTLGANAKLALRAIVNLGGNTAIYTLIPATWQPIAYLVFNLAQVIEAFVNPSFAIHLIETGQMAAPAAKNG